MKYIYIKILFFIILFIPLGSVAQTRLKETKVPDTLMPGLVHLINMVNPDNKILLDKQIVSSIIDFAVLPKSSELLYYVDKDLGATSAYREFNIKADLKRILSYAYNTDIPSNVFLPSSVRTSHWVEVNGSEQPLPKLWNFLQQQISPVTVHGIEHMEITPDLSSGAYYQYDLNRSLILFKYNNRNVFISVSRQITNSGVGKKGYILGPDNEWNYLYSGKKGISLNGLGWVSSYLYDSFAITIFYEVDPAGPMVKCGIFKWLNAGWAGINMVNKHHIHTGIGRYAKDFKAIIESSLLPDAEQLAEDFYKFKQLSQDQLKEKVKQYYCVMQEYNNNKKFFKRKYAATVTSDRYLNKLTKNEMQAVLVLEYMKYILGKKPYIEIKSLL